LPKKVADRVKSLPSLINFHLGLIEASRLCAVNPYWDSTSEGVAPLPFADEVVRAPVKQRALELLRVKDENVRLVEEPAEDRSIRVPRNGPAPDLDGVWLAVNDLADDLELWVLLPEFLGERDRTPVLHLKMRNP
jgi:hypothetical protein